MQYLSKRGTQRPFLSLHRLSPDQCVSKIENGRVEPPSEGVLQRIAKELAGNPVVESAISDVELTSWPNLYRLRNLFEVTISALMIRLERLSVLYVATDGQLYPSLQEYHGQTRLAL